jgi:ABC-2 type transport system permease protein
VNRVLLKKCFNDCRWLLLGGCVLLVSFCWIRVWVMSQIEMPRFAKIMELVWDIFGDFSVVTLEQLISYPGRVALTYVEPIVVFMMVVWGITRGSDVVSGELSRGTMEVLLSQPISRMQVLWHQSAVTIMGAFCLAFAAWLGTYAGLTTNSVILYPPSITIPIIEIELTWPLAKEQRVPMTDVCDPLVAIPAAFNLFCLGFCVAGLSTFVSAVDRYRWRTIGIVSAIFVVQLVIKGLAMTAPWLKWMLNFTFMTAFEPQLFVAVAVTQPKYNFSFWMPSMTTRGENVVGPMGYYVVLLGIGLAGYLGATYFFSRRDLPAPV